MSRRDWILFLGLVALCVAVAILKCHYDASVPQVGQ